MWQPLQPSFDANQQHMRVGIENAGSAPSETLTERGGAARLGARSDVVAGTAGTPLGDGSRLDPRSLHVPRSVSVSLAADLAAKLDAIKAREKTL